MQLQHPNLLGVENSFSTTDLFRQLAGLALDSGLFSGDNCILNLLSDPTNRQQAAMMFRNAV